MEPPSPQPFAHANESDAAPWLRPLLEHVGVPAGTAATISAAEAPTTTGAIRELRSRPADWNAFLDKLSGMLVSELGDTLDREDIRQRLLERLEEELDAVHVKRARTEAAGSSTEAQFASATTESEEVLRTKQWCNRQPIIVSRFVLRVLPPRPPRRNLWVVCKCGHECLEFDFRKHVISGQHEKEFFELLDNSEALGAQAAVLRVAEMLSDLGQRATCELMAADALRGEVRSLHSQLVALEGDLDREKRAHCLFESRYTNASARLAAQEAAMRSFTSPTARLHQELWQRGLFDKKQHPLNHTLDELHYLSLVRVSKGDDVKKGGEPLKLTPTARALATLMHAKSTASGYRLFRDVYRWPPSPDDVRRLPPVDKGGPFVAVGCHQLEWGQQAHRFYTAAGYDPRKEPFGICFDPAKIMAEVTWDPKTNAFIGHVKCDSRLGFESWAAMERFFETHVAAGYVIPFLLCPLNPRFPSAFVPVGMVSSDLTYTTVHVDSFLGQIQTGLCAAGFGHVVPTIAFDNPSVQSPPPPS